jgi:hypothetical protein
LGQLAIILEPNETSVSYFPLGLPTYTISRVVNGLCWTMTQLNQMKNAFLAALNRRTCTPSSHSSKVVLPVGRVREDELAKVIGALEQLQQIRSNQEN